MELEKLVQHATQLIVDDKTIADGIDDIIEAERPDLVLKDEEREEDYYRLQARVLRGLLIKVADKLSLNEI